VHVSLASKAAVSAPGHHPRDVAVAVGQLAGAEDAAGLQQGALAFGGVAQGLPEERQMQQPGDGGVLLLDLLRTVHVRVGRRLLHDAAAAQLGGQGVLQGTDAVLVARGCRSWTCPFTVSSTLRRSRSS